MFFTATFYLALTIFTAGLVYKISGWFRNHTGEFSKQAPFVDRVPAAAKGIVSVVMSKKCLTLFKVFVLDVILQRKLLRQSAFRWAAHMAIFIGMSLLILLHALDDVFTAALFPEYYSTLNPFFFLRNLLCAMVFIGLLLAFCRRYFSKRPRRFISAMDYNVIFLLGLIIGSGILLEAVEISSHNEFLIMVEDYAGLDPENDAEEIKGLESYWVKKFGVISPNAGEPFDPGILEQGRESHEMYCAQCHSRAQWAFASYGVSRLLSPIALTLDRLNFATLLLYIHYLSSFVALAYLPFSKMLHIFTGPLSILANAVMDKNSDPANVATRQAMELDACVHCGLCNERCTVAGSFAAFENAYIMPSEKIAAVKRLYSGKKLSKKEIRAIQNGLFFCTDCQHCTDNCPVGINLQVLWSNTKEALLQSGYPEFFLLSPLSAHRVIKWHETLSDNYQNPLKSIKQIITAEFAEHSGDANGRPIELSHLDPAPRKKLSLSLQGRTSSTCFTCKACTNICPVVANFDKPMEKLGLLPHQIIHAANLGLFGMVFGANMLWSCLGCYECQECCPQAVCVTDIFYELKNMAIAHFEEKALL